MCGIVGVQHFDIEAARPELLQRMVARIRHRGPDETGVFTDGPVGFGHARLSIIDIESGQQPMQTEDGSLTVTFNGEIFNYIELRDELLAKGHQFRTCSDTEVILHAYREYGDECVQHFNGQWAFAIWDSRKGRLFLSRDRFGIRPLFYTQTGHRFLFASEVKALFEAGITRAIDPRGLDQLFTFWTTLAPKTVFQGICELPPGHNLIVEREKVRTFSYWQLNYNVSNHDVTADDYADELLDLLADATRLRLRSDVPVGAYLSGGLDSSITTALVSHCTNRLPRTFSVTFQDREFDESEHQKRVVKHLGTDHRAIRCSYDNIADIFPDVIRHTEKPVLRTAPAPLFLLSKLVQDEGFKVVLTGEGADELFGGYDVFKEAKVRRFSAALPESRLRPLLFQQLYPYLPNIQAQSLAYRKAFFHVRPEDLSSPFFSHLPRWKMTSQLKRLFSTDYQAVLSAEDVYADSAALLPREYAGWAPFCQAQFLETVMLMPGYILSSQGDRMAMANSIEGRFPFLDHRLAEFAAKLPPRLKMKGLNEKYLLKRAAGHLVPESITKRKKQPYRAPDAESFFDSTSASSRHDYVDELLAPERIQADGVFNATAVQRLADKARQGGLVGVKDNMALVGVLSTQLVIDQLITRGRPQSAPFAPVTKDVPLVSNTSNQFL